MILVILIALCLVATIWFWIGIVYQLAKSDRWLTFNNTGEVKFVVEGGKIIKVIMDVPGMTYDAANDLIVEKKASTKESTNWLFRKIAARYQIKDGSQSGIAWVSIWYPIVKILTWDFHWLKLEPTDKAEAGKDNIFDKYSIIDKHDPKTSSLFYEYSYPVFIKDVELKGNFTISILVVVTLTVRKPVYLIGNLKGKFMAQLTSEISGLVDNGLRKESIETWRKMDKEDKIDSLLPPKKLILNEAFEIRHASYTAFDYSGNTANVIDAITLTQIESEKGDAKIVAADKDAIAAVKDKEARITRGQGEAEALRLKLKAIQASDNGVQLYMAEQQAKAIEEFGGSTLVLGSSNSMVSVGSDNSRSRGKRNKPETTTKEPEKPSKAPSDPKESKKP